MADRLLTDTNLECPYLFEMDGEKWKFKDCKTWAEAEWAKTAWDEAVAKTARIMVEGVKNDGYIKGVKD